MSDYVSRGAALNCFHDWIDQHGDVHTADEMTEYNAIAALPAADVVEVVRCKDCKHYAHMWYCDAWNNSPGFPAVSYDMFCSLAERREE